MSNYTRGRNREYQVMRTLEAEGWTVCRTAGSHSQFDVIAWRLHRLPAVRFVQVKSGRGASPDERKRLPYSTSYVTFEIWEFRERGQPPRIVVHRGAMA